MKAKKIYRMKVFPILFSSIILFGTIKLAGDVKVYLDPRYSTEADGKDIQLTAESLIYPDFPKPKNHLPVLFIHGHHYGKNKDKNFLINWQQSVNGLPCFQETLELTENAWLGIEPYYIDLEDYEDADEKKNRSIKEDARKIKEAVELILLHQDDPAAKTKKVVIIAYGSGAVSARYFLKDLWENQNKRLAFHPVSEFIAISPPNHGLNATNDFIKTMGQDSLALQQLNNGCDENCNRFSDPRSHDFIEKLNGHAIQDTLMANYCGQIFDSEAPGSRRNNEPIENGILYVSFYARGNRDIVGGSDPSNDCQGRVLAKNLAPNAVNREIPGIPGNMSYPKIPGGDDKLAVHQNTVHMPEVICKALYTAVFHQAPPDELIFKGTDADEKNWKSPPIIPQLQMPEQKAGIVLLLDISGSMSRLLPLAKRAVEPFLKLLNDYCYGNCKSNFGISVFPPLPWSFLNQKECNGQVIHPMTLVTETSVDNAIKTVNCLQAQGNTPLLNGIDTAVQLFDQENRKAIILLSDGIHNCPGAVNSHDAAVNVNDCIKNLNEKQVTLYSIACGQDLQLNHQLLRRLAEERKENLKGTFIQAMDSPINPYNYNYNDIENHGGWHPGTALNKAFKSIFTDLLKLEEVTDQVNIIKAEETKTFEVKVNEYDRKISFVLSWVTPQKGRLGLSIKTPDGKTIPNGSDGLNVHVHQGETYTIITTDEHFLKQPGKVEAAPWKVKIDAPGLKHGEQEYYQSSVIMDSALKMRTGFDKPFYETGDTITFFAAITEGKNKRPKTGLTDVFVTVTRPGEGLGNWFASNKVSAEALESIPETIANDGISMLHRKAILLTQKRKAAVFQKTSSKDVQLPLYDDGTHGDKKKGDGIYTNQYKYKETLNEGTYSFQFHASGYGDGDPFEREKTVQKYLAVKPDPDPEFSRLRIEWRDMFQDERVEYLYNVESVPKDRFGNYMGPGHRVDVKIVYNKYKYGYEGDNNHLIPLKDNLDGTYSGEIRISRSGFKTGVRLVFFIDGKTFTTVEKIPGFKKRSLGIYAGTGIPTYSFNRTHNPAINLGCHLGFRFAPQFSLIGLVGYNRFGSSSSVMDDTLWWNISGNLKSEIVKDPFRIYVNVGPGIYISKTGALKKGFNVGAGAAYSLTSKYIMEIGADFHRVYIKGLDPSFLVTYARLVYRF
jgi:hypothetical protein